MSVACDCYWVRAQDGRIPLNLCGSCMHRRGAKCLCPNRRTAVAVKAAGEWRAADDALDSLIERCDAMIRAFQSSEALKAALAVLDEGGVARE